MARDAAEGTRATCTTEGQIDWLNSDQEPYASLLAAEGRLLTCTERPDLAMALRPVADHRGYAVADAFEPHVGVHLFDGSAADVLEQIGGRR